MTAAVPTGNLADARSWLVTGDGSAAEQWIGRTTPWHTARQPVTAGAIARFAALVEDDDPSYWDRAASYHGDRLVAPPGMLMVWPFPPPWLPPGHVTPPPLAGLDVPLPGSSVINVSTETRFEEELYEGEVLSWQGEVSRISDEIETGLGPGRFITTTTRYRAGDRPIGTNVNVLLRFEPHGGRSLAPEEPTAVPGLGAGSIDPVSVDVTMSRVAAIPAATRDFFPGHHDPEYARAQGARHAYLNTMALHGLFDRVALEHAGHDGRIRRRHMRMDRPVCVGDTLTIDGERRDGGARLTLRAVTPMGIAATAMIDVASR